MSNLFKGKWEYYVEKFSTRNLRAVRKALSLDLYYIVELSAHSRKQRSPQSFEMRIKRIFAKAL